jgi:hypothetical protein
MYEIFRAVPDLLNPIVTCQLVNDRTEFAMRKLSNPFEFAGRVYYVDGRYAGRLVSVTDYFIDSLNERWVTCIVRGLGAPDNEEYFRLSDILIETP